MQAQPIATTDLFRYNGYMEHTERIDLVTTLRSLGQRLTPQRHLVLSALGEVGEHFCAEEVHALARASYTDLNLSTIYRTLDLLERLGLLTRTTGDFGDGKIRYHLAERGHHHHLVCRRCGAVLEADPAVLKPLEDSVERAYGFRIEIDHLAMFGFCARCRR